MVNYVGKEAKNNFRELENNLPGFDLHGFDRESYDRQGCYSNGFKKRIKMETRSLLIQKKKLKKKLKYIHGINIIQKTNTKLLLSNEPMQWIGTNYTWIRFFATENQYWTLISILRQGGSVFFIKKHFRNKKCLGLLAAQNNSKSFQHLGKNLEVEDIFDLAVKNKEGMRWYAREGLRKRPQSPTSFTWISNWSHNQFLQLSCRSYINKYISIHKIFLH